MALPATSVWEVRGGAGNDTNGGGFDSTGSGTDYSQQDSKNSGGNNQSVTDLVTNGTTTVTSATASFTSAINGNIVYIQGGTGSITAGWYRLTYVNSTTCTTDRSTGLSAGTGATMNIGGALATPSQAHTNAVAGNIIYFKASANYTFTSTLSLSKDSRSTTPLKLIGYTSTRTDNGRATFTTATNSTPILSITGTCVNVEVDNISFTTTASVKDDCFKCGTTGYMFAFFNCVVDGFTTGFDSNSNNAQPLIIGNCEVKNCTTSGISNGSSTYIYDSYIHGNAIGMQNPSAAGSGGNNEFLVVNCIVASNTSQGMNMTAGSVNGSFCHVDVSYCSFYSNTGDHIKITVGGNAAGLAVRNTIFYGGSAYAINFTVASQYTMMYLRYNAFGSNSSGNYNNCPTGTGDVALSSNPFTNAGSGDFSLNSTAGGGAACKAAGFPGAMIGGGTGYVDIGALQHQDAGGGSSTIIAQNITTFVGALP